MDVLLLPSSAMKRNTQIGIIFIAILVTACLGNEETSPGVQNSQQDQTESLKSPNRTLYTKLDSTYTGVAFHNIVEQTPEMNLFTNQYALNGGGVAAGDLNNDGLSDLYFTANQTSNALYLNKGDLQFINVTDQAKVAGNSNWSTGVTILDINADGWNDIYVCHAGNYLNAPQNLANELFINNGDAEIHNGVPTFSEQAEEYGLAGQSRSVQAAFFDFDNDNDLDVYVLNHPYNFFLNIDARLEAQQKLPHDESDRLCRNNGDGTFTDITEPAGVKNWAFGLSASVGDLNDDGWTDLFVANDYSEKDLYLINNGDGTFRPGEDEAFFHISNFSMGSAIADINNDLLPDLFVADMMAEDNRRKKANMSPMSPEVFYDNVGLGRHYQYMQNVLQLNNGNGTFSDIAELAGVAYTDWSWSVLLEDLDNDGWKDLYVSNGLPVDLRNSDANTRLLGKSMQELRNDYQAYLDILPSEPLANYVFSNNGDLTFSNKSEEWGLDTKGFTNGVVIADLDLDGDLDIVQNNCMGSATILRNENGTNNNYIRVRLKGPTNNPGGVGVKVQMFAGEMQFYQQLTLAKGFQSGGESILHFGIGSARLIDKIEVNWPDGKYQVIESVTANREITIQYSAANKRIVLPEKKMQWFEHITTDSSLSHTDLPYNDFAREILLPHRYSQLGPIMASADVNGDGRSDLVIPGAYNQSTQLYLQTPHQGFELSASQPWSAHAGAEDIVACFFDVDGDLDPDLYLGAGGNEWELGHLAYRDRLYINDGKGNFTHDANAIPNIRISSGCVAAEDIDGDGDIDLFVGGRLVPGAYPEPARSIILENSGGKFTDVTNQWSKDLLRPGMITDAQWIDYNNDKRPDLLVAGEWMPVKIFENKGTNFEDVTEKAGLESYKGWWYSLQACDPDDDGDIDFVAGNLGLNSKYQASDQEPLQVYYHDFDGNGTNDIVLSYFNKGLPYPVRGRECSSQQMPSIKTQFATYEAFASATLPDIYGDDLDQAMNLKANWLASTYFENIGNGEFKAHKLPNEAQVSSILDILVEDVNFDGFPDLIVAGNMYQAEVETCRHDASVGLVLTGDGNGFFKPVPTLTSGFSAPGDVKSLVIMPIDNETTIAVGRNNGTIQLLNLKGG